MKSIEKAIIITLCIVALLIAAGCSNNAGNKSNFDLSLFNINGIYAGYDDLTKEEQEQFLVDAANNGFAIGIDKSGRLTLTKDEKTYFLGKSNKDDTEKEKVETTTENGTTTVGRITTFNTAAAPSTALLEDLCIDEEIMGNE